MVTPRPKNDSLITHHHHHFNKIAFLLGHQNGNKGMCYNYNYFSMELGQAHRATSD